LIADEDGVFDPQDPTDRLVWGLNGILSEMELHTMKVRWERGRLSKAQRGELFHAVPGLVRVLGQRQRVVPLLGDSRHRELGHAIGLAHVAGEEDLLAEILQPGTRRLPPVAAVDEVLASGAWLD
jgi:hypothetical protein